MFALHGSITQLERNKCHLTRSESGCKTIHEWFLARHAEYT